MNRGWVHVHTCTCTHACVYIGMIDSICQHIHTVYSALCSHSMLLYCTSTCVCTHICNESSFLNFLVVVPTSSLNGSAQLFTGKDALLYMYIHNKKEATLCVHVHNYGHFTCTSLEELMKILIKYLEIYMYVIVSPVERLHCTCTCVVLHNYNGFSLTHYNDIHVHWWLRGWSRKGGLGG